MKWDAADQRHPHLPKEQPVAFGNNKSLLVAQVCEVNVLVVRL